MKWFRSAVLLGLLTAFSVACGSDSVGPQEDAPQMDLPESLSIQAMVGEAADETLTVENGGVDTLNAEFFVDEDADWLSVDPRQVSVSGEDFEELVVTATCPDEVGEFDTVLDVTSNDPDRSEASVSVSLSCSDTPVADPATLTVDIEGLDEGVDADVVVEGPDSFEAALTASQTLDELDAGNYVVHAFPVGDDDEFVPAVDEFELTLESGDSQDVTIEYLAEGELGLGELSVWFAGLPEGVDGTATVEGPDEFSAEIEGDDTLTDLEPGSYEVIPDDIEVESVTYFASAVTVDIEAGDEQGVEIAYGDIPGDLQVEVLGLPEGVDHEIDLVDEDDTVTELPQNGELTGLQPGDYVLQPHEVLDGESLYVASDVDVTIVSDDVTEATVEYLLDPGQLVVTVEGLPSGVDHEIELVAADGTRTDLPQSGEMAAVEPGEYTLEAGDVDDGLATYIADDGEISIDSNEETTATVTYDLVYAEWELVIDGLPSGIAGAVDVSGGTLDDTFSETTTFNDLVPDTYEIEADDVDDGDLTTFSPTPASTTADLESGTNDATTIEYEMVLGSLDLSSNLPSGIDLNADITGPDSSTDNYDEAQVIDDLVPGEYTVTFNEVDDGNNNVYGADPVIVDVESGETAPAAGDYDIVLGGLEIATDGLPSGFPVDVHIDGPDFDENRSGTQTIADLTPGEYTVTFEDSELNDVIYRPETLEVVVDVVSNDVTTATGEFDVVLGALQLASLGLPSGVDLEAAVTDPGGSTEDYDEAVTISDLEPGEYSVTFDGVEDDGVIYDADDDPVVVNVISEDTTTATGTYVAVPGDLRVRSTGLPPGLDLEAEVSGPGYNGSVNETTTIANIDGGDYTVTFDDVEEGGAKYEPAASTVDVRVLSNMEVDATGEYEAVPGELEVISDFPSDIEIDIEILDADGLTADSGTVSGGESAIFSGLDPEYHTVVATSVIEDEWDNEYVNTFGFDSPVGIDSELTSQITISGLLPTEVQNGDDDGDDSLREVVERVNATSVITFADDVDEVSLTGGAIAITKPLSIIGDDDGWTEIHADGTHRIFEVAADSELFLQALHLHGGYHASGGQFNGGGAIRARSEVTLFDVELSNNEAFDGRGGAIYTSELLTLNGVTAHGNSATSVWGDGGAIATTGGLDAEDVHFYENESESWWGGALWLGGGSVAITDAHFENNSAGSNGGAIYTSSLSETMTINRSLFVENESGGSAGAIRLADSAEVTNSTFFDNDASNNGGAIYVNLSGSISLFHTTIAENTATSGPALFLDLSSTNNVLSRTLIADNGNDDQSEISGPFESEDFNFIGRVDETFDEQDNDIIGDTDDPIDAELGTFGDHGGNLHTVSLEESSPAYQAIPEDECTVDEDQRGFARPNNGFCTIGAWEASDITTYLEDFENADFDGGYDDGEFVGNNGLLWEYEGVATEGSFEIDGVGAMVRDAGAGVWSEDIPGGIDTFSVEYRAAWGNTSPRQFEVLVNGDVVATSPEFGTDEDELDTIYTLEVDDIDVTGEFTLEIRKLPPSGTAQLVLDNIRWAP